MEALNALEVIGVRPEYWKTIQSAGEGTTTLDARYRNYIPRILADIEAKLK